MEEIRFKLVPGASKDGIAGSDAEGNIRLRVTKPPVDGQANTACIKFLAKHLGVPKTSITIVSGTTSRLKTLRFARGENIRQQLLDES